MVSHLSDRVIVDSTVYIGLLRRGVDPIKEIGRWAAGRDLMTCGMIRLEVIRGVRIPKIRKGLNLYFEVLADIATTSVIWSEAAEMAWQLDRKGIVLPAQDVLIAACARSVRAAILTDDRHFCRIPGLSVLTPDFELPCWRDT